MNFYFNQIKYSALGEWFVRISQPLILLLLTKFLTPLEFGIAAAATMLLTLSQIIWEGGVQKIILTRKSLSNEFLENVFSLQIFLAFAISAVNLIAFPYLNQIIFENNVSIELIILINLNMIISAACSLKLMQLQKDFKYKTLLSIKVIATIVFFISSIILALLNFTYWSIIVGTALAKLAQLITLHVHYKDLPRLIFKLKHAKEIINYMKWTMTSAFLAWFFLWADSLIVTQIYGLEVLGVYRYAYGIIALLSAILLNPIYPIIQSKIARIVEHVIEIRRLIVACEQFLMILVFSILVTLTLNLDTAYHFLENTKYVQSSEYLAPMLCASLIAQMASIRQLVYPIIGLEKVETKIMIISGAIRLLFYIFAAQYSIVIFLWFKVLSTVIGLINHSYFSKKYLKLGIRMHLKLLINLVSTSILISTIIWAMKLLYTENLMLILITTIVLSCISFGWFIISSFSDLRWHFNKL